MATTTFEFPCFSGETVTLKLYTEKTDTEVSSVAATERTNKKGYYTCSLVDVATGAYDWRAVSGSDTFVTGQLDHTNSAGLTEQPRGTNVRDDVGLAAANLDAQLAAISDDIDASVLGTGARLVTITVVDLDTGDPIQDARVRLSAAGIGTRVKRTNASGVVSFSADDADYDVTITAADHDFTPTTLTVNGNETVTYEMSGQDWPDSTEPDTVTVRWRVMSYTTRQPVGAAEATVYMRIRNGPYQDGFAWNRTADSDTTDASGYVSFANVPVHCTVEARLGTTGDWIPVEIPSDATSPYDAAPLWGALPDA